MEDTNGNAQAAQGNESGQQGGQQGAAFDPAALTKTIQDSIKAGFEAMRPQQDEPQTHQHVGPDQAYLRTGQTQQADADPVARVIAPIVGPPLQAVSLQAQAAMDAATFYATNPDAVKYRDKIEAKFAETMAVGRPVPRQDILNWMRGGPLFKEMVEEEVKRRQEAIANANAATTAGGGQRPQTAPGKSAWDMSDEELTKALQSVPF